MPTTVPAAPSSESAASRATQACRGPVAPCVGLRQPGPRRVDVGPAAGRPAAVAGRPDPLVVQRREQVGRVVGGRRGQPDDVVGQLDRPPVRGSRPER